MRKASDRHVLLFDLDTKGINRYGMPLRRRITQPNKSEWRCRNFGISTFLILFIEKPAAFLLITALPEVDHLYAFLLLRVSYIER